MSHATLIIDPSKHAEEPQHQGALLHPLGARSRYAFERLSELDPERVSRSPLLKALVEFKERRLPQLLEKISSPFPTPTIDPAAFERLSCEPRRAEALLSRIVREIDSQLPGYFSTERDTGVLKWLESGGSLPTEYAVAEELSRSPSVIQKAHHLMKDVTGTRVLFDLKNQTTHVGSVSNPTTQTVLSSLCTSGSLGEEIIEFNRAALLSLTTPLIRDCVKASEAQDPVAHMRNLLEANPQASSFLRWRLLACISGAGFVTAIAGQTFLHIFRGSVSGIDVVGPVFALFVGKLTARFFGEYRAMKRMLHDGAVKLVEKFEEHTSGGGSAILRMFPASVLDHVVHMSGGRQHTTFGERTEADWKASLPHLAVSDTNIFPSKCVEAAPDVEVECPEPLRMDCAMIEDFSNLSCDLKDIVELAGPGLLRATHIERGAAVWSTLHALTILRDFTETQGILTPEALWFDYREALTERGGAKVNETGTYPELAAAFARVTGHFQINRPTWDQISLALQAASTLERVSQTRKAQAIALEAVREEFAV